MSQRAIQNFLREQTLDPNLNKCCASTRGIWIALFCALREPAAMGVLTGTVEQIAILARCSSGEMTLAMDELSKNQVATVDQEGVVYRVSHPETIRNSKIKTQTSARVKRHRSKSANQPVTQQSNASVTHFVTQDVTQSNSPVSGGLEECNASETHLVTQGVTRDVTQSCPPSPFPPPHPPYTPTPERGMNKRTREEDQKYQPGSERIFRGPLEYDEDSAVELAKMRGVEEEYARTTYLMILSQGGRAQNGQLVADWGHFILAAWRARRLRDKEAQSGGFKNPRHEARKRVEEIDWSDPNTTF